jgi:hypothetical protein
MCKEHYILAILGIFIHMAWSILNRKHKNVPFSFLYIICNAKNYIRVSLAFASTTAILLMLDDIIRVFDLQLSGETPAKHLVSFFAGYFNHSLMKKIVIIFNKQLNK